MSFGEMKAEESGIELPNISMLSRYNDTAAMLCAHDRAKSIGTCYCLTIRTEKTLKSYPKFQACG